MRTHGCVDLSAEKEKELKKFMELIERGGEEVSLVECGIFLVVSNHFD
jgi:hypothetical protein